MTLSGWPSGVSGLDRRPRGLAEALPQRFGSGPGGKGQVETDGLSPGAVRLCAGREHPGPLFACRREAFCKAARVPDFDDEPLLQAVAAEAAVAASAVQVLTRREGRL